MYHFSTKFSNCWKICWQYGSLLNSSMQFTLSSNLIDNQYYPGNLRKCKPGVFLLCIFKITKILKLMYYYKLNLYSVGFLKKVTEKIVYKVEHCHVYHNDIIINLSSMSILATISGFWYRSSHGNVCIDSWFLTSALCLASITSYPRSFGIRIQFHISTICT